MHVFSIEGPRRGCGHVEYAEEVAYEAGGPAGQCQLSLGPRRYTNVFE